MGTATRTVRHGAVSVNVNARDSLVRLRCDMHLVDQEIDLGGVKFGRQLVGFLHAHQQCSDNVAAVSTGRGSRDF